jgi:hypothetical protein
MSMTHSGRDPAAARGRIMVSVRARVYPAEACRDRAFLALGVTSTNLDTRGGGGAAGGGSRSSPRPVGTRCGPTSRPWGYRPPCRAAAGVASIFLCVPRPPAPCGALAVDLFGAKFARTEHGPALAAYRREFGQWSRPPEALPLSGGVSIQALAPVGEPRAVGGAPGALSSNSPGGNRRVVRTTEH